jgi:D-amino-acid dehydrogenase
VAGIVERLADLGETDTGYRRVGAIVLGHDDAEVTAAEQRVERRTAGDPTVGEVRRLTGDEARACFPPLRADLPGLWIGGGARLDGRALTASLLRAACLDVRRGEARLVVDGDQVRGVELGGTRLDADAVVVAGGAWTNGLLVAHGASVDVEPQKGQIIHLRVARDCDATTTGEWPSILPPGPHYLLAFDGGRVVVGATRETGSGFDTRVTAAGQAEVLAAALEWAPGLADATVVETRVGLRPLATDGRPTIGASPDLDGLFVGTGMGASGLTIGPLAGRLLSDRILDR